jgi:hypothetical protein
VNHQAPGRGERTDGVIDHISKELAEILACLDADDRAKEWVDVVILGLDGLTRAILAHNSQDPYEIVEFRTGDVAYEACRLIVEKQGLNEWREWPDWRTAPVGKAIEHDRSGEAAEQATPDFAEVEGYSAELHRALAFMVAQADRNQRPGGGSDVPAWVRSALGGEP